LLASPKKFGMHNSIPKCVSTGNISTTPSFHIHGVGTYILSKERMKCCFLVEYIQTSQSLSSNIDTTEKKKRGRKKKISVEKKEREKEELQKSHMRKGIQFLYRIKTFPLEFLFFVGVSFLCLPSFKFQTLSSKMF
jgi:hypothetical protein